jgi:hypothetical protein
MKVLPPLLRLTAAPQSGNAAVERGPERGR